jgi:hypothetical protein
MILDGPDRSPFAHARSDDGRCAHSNGEPRQAFLASNGLAVYGVYGLFERRWLRTDRTIADTVVWNACLTLQHT